MIQSRTSRCASRAPVAKAILGLLVFAAEPQAAAAVEPASPLLDRMAITTGSYFSTLGTDVSADDTRRGIGTRLNFEDDLDFDGEDTLFRLEGQFLVGRRHQINLGFYDLDRDSQTLLRREVTFGGETFPVNADVSGYFDTQVAELSYTYWLVAKEKVAFGLNGGVQNVQIETGVDLSPVRLEAGIEEDLSIDEFVPLVGAEVRTSLAKKLQFRALGRFVTASNLGDIESVDVFDFTVALEHRTFTKAGFGIAYRGFVVDVEIQKRFTGGEIDYEIDGFEAYLRFWL